MGPLGDEAERSVREAGLANTERPVEAGPVVLPGNRRSELRELSVREVSQQLLAQCRGDLGRRGRHGDGEVEGELLELREPTAVAVAMELEEVLVRDAQRPADGRADVESERAADAARHLECGQLLEAGIDR